MLMLASTIQFSNNTHHHTATHPHPEGAWYVSADAQQQQKGRVLSDTQQCADETPSTGQAGHQGDKNYRVSVPPNNMSNRISHIRADQRYYCSLERR